MRFLKFDRPGGEGRVFINAEWIESVVEEEGNTDIVAREFTYRVAGSADDVMDAITAYETSRRGA
jgi:hypothetical protein